MKLELDDEGTRGREATVSAFAQRANRKKSTLSISRARTFKSQDTRGVGQLTANDLDLDAEQMENFVKTGIKKPYISVKPKKQQLYFLYKLILNRKLF